MTTAIRHHLLVGTSILLLLAQAGCAARPVAVAPRGQDARQAVSTEGEATDCEAFARAEAAGLRRPSAGRAFLKTFGTGVLAGAGAVLTLGQCFSCLLAAPFLILGAPFEAASVSRDNQRAREAARAAALELCHKPAILEAELGPDHPDLARSLRDLAAHYAALAQLDQAEALHRRALGIRERALPEGHPDIAESLEMIAALLRGSNRVEEAEAMERRGTAIREDEEGQARATGRLAAFARTLSERGSAEASAGDPASAERHYRRALAIQESALGVDPEDLRRTLDGYAELLQRTERGAEAAELAARARALPAGEANPPLAAPVDDGEPTESPE